MLYIFFNRLGSNEQILLEGLLNKIKIAYYMYDLNDENLPDITDSDKVLLVFKKTKAKNRTEILFQEKYPNITNYYSIEPLTIIANNKESYGELSSILQDVYNSQNILSMDKSFLNSILIDVIKYIMENKDFNKQYNIELANGEYIRIVQEKDNSGNMFTIKDVLMAYIISKIFNIKQFNIIKGENNE